MLTMPPLETERLIIRPFTRADGEAVYQLLDLALAPDETAANPAAARAARERWLDWTVLNYEMLAALFQPPYGDRAIVLKEGEALIGACGYVPCLAPFGQLPGTRSPTGDTPGFASTEFGLYYAIDPGHRQRGYATEAARALADYAFAELRLRRIVATTDYDNAGSQGVMRRLGMRVERNPLPTPSWLQVVGTLENPRAGV